MCTLHDVSQRRLPSSPAQSPALVGMQSAPLAFFFQAQIGVRTQGACVALCPPSALERGHQLQKQ